MSNPKAMGALRAFSEAFRLLYTNLKPMIPTILLLLVPCDGMSSLAERYLPPLLSLDPKFFFDETVADEAFPIPTNKIEIHLVSIIISRLSMVIKVYLSIMACSREKPTLEALSRRARKTWWRPAITVLFAVPFHYLPPLVVFALSSKILPSWRTSYVPDWIPLLIVIMLNFGMLASLAVLDLVETWGLVASLQEKECYGMKAFGKAWGFMKRRKIQVLVLTMAMLLLGTGISKVCAFGKVDRWEDVTLVMCIPHYIAKSLVVAFSNLGSIYEWLVYTALYCHMKDRE